MKRPAFRLIFSILLIIQLTVFNFAQINSNTAVRENATKLEIGKPVERDLKGGETHVFSIQAQANQLLDLIVEQRGIDVVVELIAPDGKKLAEVDSPNGSLGPEPISIIAETSGVYLLNVRSLDKESSAGRYEAKIIELRAATTQDVNRYAAQKLLNEGLALATSQQTAETRQKTLQKYQESIKFFRLAGDARGEIDALRHIGSVYRGMGEHQTAIDYYQQSLALARRIEDKVTQSYALGSMGGVYASMGEQEKALESLNQMLALRRELNDKALEADGFNIIGIYYLSIGERQKALDYFNQALALYKAINDRGKTAVELNNMGAVYYELGEIQKAVEYLDQARLIWHNMGAFDDETITLNNLGVFYMELGEFQKALEYLIPLPERQRELGDQRSEIRALNNIGRTYHRLGDAQKALAFYMQALPLSRETNDRVIEGIILTNLGSLNFDAGEFQKALDFYTQALALHRAVLNRGQEAGTLSLIARVERSRGNYVQARNAIESAIAIIESLRTNILTQQLRTSYTASAQEHYGLYIDILMRLHKQNPSARFDVAAFEISERARARSLLDILAESKVNIRQGVESDLLEREQNLQKQLNDKAVRQMRLLGGKHTPEQAAAAKKDIEAIVAQMEEVKTQIRQRSPRYAALTQPQALTSREIQSDVLDADTALLEYSLGKEHSYLWVVTKDSIKSFELPPSSKIETDVRRVVSLLNDGKRWATDTKINAEYAEKAELLSRTLLPPALLSQLKGKRLAIVSDGALQYLSFGALPALYASQNTKIKNQKTETEPLAVGFEIVTLPSASTLAVLRRETASRKQASKSIAVFADPVFTDTDERLATVKANQPKDKKQTTAVFNNSRMVLERIYNLRGESTEPLPIARLPFTRREAEAILGFAPANSWLKALDFTAKRESVLSRELADYRIVHFATHGLLNSEHPELSGIVLSLVNEQGEPVDGFLRLNEIYNLNLSADLVVLSACQTALGKEVKGEGLIGLTRGFMYAGSPRVVASLWKVDDAATADLMKIFYRKMLQERMTPSAALRAAKVEMRKQKRWSAPFYWAAFELQGEWR